MRKTVIFIGIGSAAVAIFPFISPSPFYIHLVLMVFLYATMGQAWNILGGFTGQISLGNAMFFGTGAYASALLITKFGINPWIGLVAGGFCALLISQVIAYPFFRMTGHYFAVATLVMAEIIQTLMVNWDYCGGARGLWIPIVDESVINLQFHASKTPYYFIGFIIMCAMFFFTYLIKESKWGYYFRAIKDEAETARSRGINTTLYKCFSFAISAFVTGLVGAFYAQYVMFISPSNVYIITLSITVALISILGGLGSLWGPLIGTAILIPLSELSRAYLGGGERAIDQIVYGILIMIIAVYQPKGIIGLFHKEEESGTS
jgi:branched-chain amino acid transport system permease protein